MIIFDLDGTLADCEHRRHFVERSEKPDWRAFFEACDQDNLIEPTAIILLNLWIKQGEIIEIWSGRSEAVRKKTETWLQENIFSHGIEMCPLKMRPIGDYTPDDELKERWLNERCSDLMEARIEGRMPTKHDIEFVFDDRPKVVDMWRRRGIFVFDCNQSGKEF
jgi:phosphoglycolate phosphatase-like HAD superfamily hydrolase